MNNEQIEKQDFSDDFVATFGYVYKRCLFWRDFFGLYDVYILVRSGDTIEGTEIQCLYDHHSKTAEIVVSEELEEREPEYLDRLAHHEICETLLGPLNFLAMARNYNESVLEAETHSVINRLWNIHKQFADDGSVANCKGTECGICSHKKAPAQ